MASGPRVDLSHRNAVGRRPQKCSTRDCALRVPSPQAELMPASGRMDWTPPSSQAEALTPQTSDRPAGKGPRTRSATTRGAMRTWRDRTRYATRIQVAWRRWRLVKKDVRVRLRAKGAARSVQRWWRMLQSKHRLQVILARLWWRLTIDMLQVDGAARRLQGGVRMVLLRKFRRSAAVAVFRIQTWWRGASVRLAVRRLLQASVALQRWRRRHLRHRRLRCIILQAVSWEKSARRVQAAWRGSQSRKQHAKEIDLLRKARSKRRAVLRKAQLEGRRRILSQPTRRVMMTALILPDRRSTDLSVPVRTAGKGGEEPESRAVQAPGANRTSASSAKPQLKKLVLDNRLLLDGRLERLAKSPRSQAALSPRDALKLSGTGSISRSPRALANGSSTPAHPPASKTADADLLLAELMSCGLVSSTPRAPPWPHEQPGRSDIEAVRSWLSVSLPTSEVRNVMRVECTLATAAYTAVSKTLGPERLLWHGTAWDSVANIVRHGFNRAYSGRHGAKLGRGSYFAEDAAYALRFCGRCTPRALFLAGVLPGRCCRGEENLVEPPADKSDASGARYDSTVDDPERPKVFCVFKDFQALPLYLAEIA